MASSLSVLLLLAVGGMAVAESPPAARVYSQLPPTEPVFVSSKKPLPVQESPKPVFAPTVVRTQAVQPAPTVPEPPSVSDALKEYQILLDSPSPERLFSTLDSEQMLEKRMRQQALQRKPPEAVQFPEKPSLGSTAFQGRNFPKQMVVTEPPFVNHNRLYFEDKNSERYGWDLGFIQPLVSTLTFFKDVAFMPYKVATRPLQRYETSAGHCLPGDPVPYILYPPELSVPGSILEGAAVVGMFALLIP